MRRKREQSAWFAEEVRDLRAAETVQMWTQYGCISMVEYLEVRCGIEARTAIERLRVAHALAELPMLEAELGPGVAGTLARTADLLRADTEYLDAVADAALESALEANGESEQVDLAVPTLEQLPGAIRSRVLRLAALQAGAVPAQLFHTHVVAIDRLVSDWHGQKWVELPGHVRASRSKDLLSFTRAEPD